MYLKTTIVIKNEEVKYRVHVFEVHNKLENRLKSCFKCSFLYICARANILFT